MIATRHVVRAGAFALALVLGLLAFRLGGGAERAAPPAPELLGARATTTTRAARSRAEEREVAIRLVEHVKETDAPGDPSSFVRGVSVALGPGSSDRREALVAPVPATFTFRVNVPAGATLAFARAARGTTTDAVGHVVTLVDAKGDSHELFRERLPPNAPAWTDTEIDLAAFAGQDVVLRLATERAPEETPKSTTKPRAAARPAKPHAAPATPTPTIALWGNPTITTRAAPRVPFNVLFVVVDGLRADAVASFHDDEEDAARARAEVPPLDAVLPKMPGLTPHLDALAARGVRFTRAYSAATWTRPGTLALLAGARSSDLGIDQARFALDPAAVLRFHASAPPLLPRLLRPRGVTTAAFVNNPFMSPDAREGVDMGFERLVEHRHRTADSLAITRDATAFLRAHAATRFFAYVHLASPRPPFEPPKELEARVPKPPAGPADPATRRYLGEVAKDDEAVGAIVRALDDAGLRERTVVVVAADHGEPLASNHEGTARIPLLVVAPSLLPEGQLTSARVSSIDVAPTLVELLDLEPDTHTKGRSLVGLARGEREPEERVVVTEGRGTRAILHGRHRLVVREGAARVTRTSGRTITADEELYDLVTDPGERRDLARAQPDLVAEMRARLEAALAYVPVAGSVTPAEKIEKPVLRLRFVGGGRAIRVAGTLRLGDARTKVTHVEVSPLDLGADAWKLDEPGAKIDVAFTTSPSHVVGFDLVVDPPSAPVAWELWRDDRPWPADRVFGGPYGLVAPDLRGGIVTDALRTAIAAPRLPPIDPARDDGVFVVRDLGRPQ